MPNPWLCTQDKVKAEATTQRLEFKEVYADKLMNFMSDWFTHCVEKNKDIHNLHLKHVKIPGRIFDHFLEKQGAKEVVENLRDCLIRTCEASGHTVVNGGELLTVDVTTLQREMKKIPAVGVTNVNKATIAMFVDKCVGVGVYA